MPKGRILIISPHTDDAIFSLGDHIVAYKNSDYDVTILSVFSGVPNEGPGVRKHRILREEHKKACELLGVKTINWDLLDDAEDSPTSDEHLRNWFFDLDMDGYDKVFVPIGIHHPDHIQVSNCFTFPFKPNNIYVYQELPYATLYPDLFEDRLIEANLLNAHHRTVAKTTQKRAAVALYESQLKSDHIMSEIMVQEYIWKIQR